MEKINLRGLILGSLAVIVVTQFACAAWLGRQLAEYRPADNTSEFAAITEQLASLESAVSDVQDTADNVQGRTEALVASMSSVARACSFR